jgi:hypothetical protein
MQYEWVTIGDNSSCDACNELNGQIFEEEDLPEGSDVCFGGDSCRCTPVPLSLMEDPEVDKVLQDTADKMMNRVITDQTSGKRIILKHFEGIKGLGTLPYEVLANYEGLIIRYNAEVGTLPTSWYSLKDIQKQIDWLESELV